MSQVFISYKREDQAIAEWLANQLTKNAVTVWWDPNLRGGEHFDDAIEQQLASASCVVVLWSAKSVRSQYVKDEATYALNQNKIIPLTIDGTLPPFRFQGIHTINIRDIRGPRNSANLEPLLQALSPYLSGNGNTHESLPLVDVSRRSRLSSSTQVDDSDQSDAASLVSGALSFVKSRGLKNNGVGFTTCTGFKPTENPDHFKIEIVVSGLWFTNEARLKEEAATFMSECGYQHYEVLDKKYGIFGGKFTYLVAFS